MDMAGSDSKTTDKLESDGLELSSSKTSHLDKPEGDSESTDKLELDELPNELKMEILSYLNAEKDLPTMRLVSKSWNNIVHASGLVEFNLELTNDTVETVKNSSPESMRQIAQLFAWDLKDSLEPLPLGLKQLLRTTEKLTFGKYCACGGGCMSGNQFNRPFNGQNIVTLLKNCTDLQALSFRVEVLNEIIDENPVMLRSIRLELLSEMSLTFDSDTDTTVVLGLMQLEAPSLRELSLTRVLICYCSKCSPYFGKTIYLGLLKFIGRHAESIKDLKLHNVGTYDRRSDLQPEPRTLRKREFSQYGHSVQNDYIRLEKYRQSVCKFDPTKFADFDADELRIIENLRKLKLKNFTIHHKIGDGLFHDFRFLKELIEAQTEMEEVKLTTTSQTLRTMIIENLTKSKTTLKDLQLEISTGFDAQYFLNKKYYEDLQLLDTLKLGGNIRLDDYGLLSPTLTTLIIDSAELTEQDFNAICSKLVNLNNFVYRRQGRLRAPTNPYDFEPIFHNMLTRLQNLEFLHIGLNIISTKLESIGNFCMNSENLLWIPFSSWRPISRMYYEHSVLILIEH